MIDLLWIMPLMVVAFVAAMLIGVGLGALLFKIGKVTGINNLIYRYLDWLGL